MWMTWGDGVRMLVDCGQKVGWFVSLVAGVNFTIFLV